MVQQPQPTSGGFRLQYVEVFNWGTFDQHIWRLEPDLNNSLLTGANGSGKTTLVDALVTLLVPPNKRHYNQSSGAERKRERDETSYTLGAYSTAQSESGLAANTRYLRDKENAYSILIGLFYNSSSREYLALAQVRWFANHTLKKTYFAARQPLNITAHFRPMDASGAWKRRLKKEVEIQEFDTFSKYAQYFSKAFGLKSEKALSLFSLTVGIKVLGNLNEFIRTNMLEEQNTEEEFLKLREHYENLLSSYQSIERAREQLQLLRPIIEESRRYESLRDELEAVKKLEAQIIPFFAQQKVRVFEAARREAELDIQRKEDQIAGHRHQITTLRDQENALHLAISNDKVYAQLQHLENQIQLAERELGARQRQAQRYNRLAERLDLKADPDERRFYKTLQNAREQLDPLQNRIEEAQQARLQLGVELEQRKKEKTEQEDLLQSLQKRRNRLPMEQVRIRANLLEKLPLSEKQLPFAAELIQIDSDAKDWEPYLEQLLRPLGLSLLVDETHYPDVLESIHRQQLDGKIGLLRTVEVLLVQQNPIQGGLLEKIQIREDSAHASWLRQYLQLHYDYACVEGFTALDHYEQSLNNKGLSKNRAYYQRDDKAERLSESQHILGWDNQATILAVQRRIRELEGEIEERRRILARRRDEETDLQEQRDDWKRLMDFESFQEVDVKRLSREIREFRKEREQLLASSDQLKDMKKRLENVCADIRQREAESDRLFEQKGKSESRRENFEARLEEAHRTLEQFAGFEPEAVAEAIRPYLEAGELRTSNIDPEEKRVSKTIAGIREEKDRQLQKSGASIEKNMQKFIQPSEAILQQHPGWTAETADLRADLHYLREFKRFHQKVAEEDLPKFRERFKNWLNERLIFDIANFKTALDNQEAIIEESIKTINYSLKEIDFNINPTTYIQLDVHKTRDTAVREFKQMLREAMPDPGKLARGDDKELEAGFKRIKRIIEELSANEQWRRRVTDVRNWLEFGAIERFRSDDAERQYYLDSQSLSGGEKAKLAYTILASAIAYQFGIRDANSRRRSFRFAVIDEAFSKVDPENAIYAMELFQRLHLQLMVITPLDKINLAEPYIQTVHYVHNREKRNSQVLDLPLEVYQAQKEAFQSSEKA